MVNRLRQEIPTVGAKGALRCKTPTQAIAAINAFEALEHTRGLEQRVRELEESLAAARANNKALSAEVQQLRARETALLILINLVTREQTPRIINSCGKPDWYPKYPGPSKILLFEKILSDNNFLDPIDTTFLKQEKYLLPGPGERRYW